MAKRIHPFELAAERMENDARAAFKGNPVSTKYASLRLSTDLKVIGRNYPQTNKIDLATADLLHFDRLPEVPVRFDRIELGKSMKLTDCISQGVWSADAFILSARAIDVFERFNLGVYRIHPATVYHRSVPNDYGVLHVINAAQGELDFERSRFHITDIGGAFKAGIEVSSKEDFHEKRELVDHGRYPGTKEFDSLTLTWGIFKEGVVLPDIFNIQCARTSTHISTRLAQAIDENGLTGFNIEPVMDLSDTSQ